MYATKLNSRHLIIRTLSLLLYGYVILPGVANENILRMLEKDFQKIVAEAHPAVVKVVATQTVQLSRSSDREKLAVTRQNIGSGIVIDTEGHIVTTTFEMETPSTIEIIFKNKKVASADLIGTDTLTDIAVLRLAEVPATPPVTPATDGIAPPREWGDSSKINTGSWVVTIGCTYGESPILAFGIVGGWDTLPNHLCGDLIKINAAVTPGNSGGALVNTSGEVVGMIHAVLTEPVPTDSPADVLFKKQEDMNMTQLLVQSPRNQKITFAIPIERVRDVAKEIIAHGRVARGWLGVEVDAGESGVFVTNVIADGPAHRGGLLPEDLILEFDEIPVRSYAELSRCVISKRPNTTVRLKVDRNGTAQHYTVILGEKR